MPSAGCVFGLDAGATQTRLCARSLTGDPDLKVFGSAANVFRQGELQTAEILSCLINKALEKLPEIDLLAIHAGVAGASAPSTQKALADHIRSLIDRKDSLQISISHDGVNAIEGALGSEGGLLFIAGTGSGVMARTTKNHRQIDHVGGWGYLIGDEGSGYSIGRRGMAAVGHAFDGGPATTLTDLVRDHLNIHDRYSLLKSITSPDWKFQHVAPLVLQASSDDAVACAIVHDETTLLAHQSEWLLKKHPNLNPRFTITGGLSNHELYVASMCNSMRRIWPAADYTPPTGTPLEGAVQIAIRQITGSDAPQ
jgi:N-acetylglucosamine kinase-like BadF-type ATPase